ncbi:hypothetical protein D3C81_1311380 [compost metagenome]
MVNEQPDAKRTGFADQRVDHRLGLVGHRKHPPVVLLFERDAQIFEERNDIPVAEQGKRAVQKSPSAWNIGNQLIDILIVGHITASATGNAQLSPQLVPFIEQRHVSTLFRRRNGSHQPGGAAADDDYVYIFHVRILSICTFLLFSKLCIIVKLCRL